MGHGFYRSWTRTGQEKLEPRVRNRKGWTQVEPGIWEKDGQSRHSPAVDTPQPAGGKTVELFATELGDDPSKSGLQNTNARQTRRWMRRRKLQLIMHAFREEIRRETGKLSAKQLQQSNDRQAELMEQFLNMCDDGSPNP